ncbi:hypothetical protein OSB04_031989 [Centaurea solstitialis]|uniref:Zinc-ribbon domain-containing protein n=1 Tax=Centaurea solstitialis TaxID=347529 RepID=A0AA38W8M8_9ASTR|nr:hypothetical protein OSB04_031989 [Centaurea solstitialis]
MSEIIASEVCLVRCPKCENLIQEITDYSVYQCGGCGAVLRARSKPIESMPLSDKEESGLLNQNPERLRDADFSNRKPTNSSLGFDQDDVKRDVSTKIDNTTNEQIVSLKTDQESEDLETRINGSRRPVWSPIRRHRNNRFQDREMDEGPSNYHFRSGNVYVEPEVNDDRVELLRKLDELKDQIVRSRPLGDQPKEKASVFNDPISRRVPFDQNPYHRYFPGPQFRKDSGDFRKFHHPNCSCLVCYSNCRHACLPPPLPPLLPRPPPPPPLPVYYRHDHNPRFSQWSGDLRRPPRRGILSAGGRRCHLVAGGSPFVACCNCFELLQMPDQRNTRRKIRCAACSEIISLSVVDKKLIMSSENGVGNGKITRRNTKWRSMGSSFDGFDFRSLDRLPLRTRSLTSFKSTRSVRSSSSYTSEPEAEPGLGLIKDPKPESRKPSSPPSGSRLQDHFDYSTDSLQNSMKDVAVATEIEISAHEYSVNTGTSRESADQRNETGGGVNLSSWPFIDELNYPMPKNCADGHTGVFVNGRELHEKDLNLLASRGLPMDRDRSYIIEISGRVLDEGSGNELQCLGKLAPTVESKRYGFGMKPPKTTT